LFFRAGGPIYELAKTRFVRFLTARKGVCPIFLIIAGLTL